MTSHRGLLHHMLVMVSDLKRSAPFYAAMFQYLGYELAGEDETYRDWKRWDVETPHEISICQVTDARRDVPHVPGAVGHHHHIAFCAADTEDVDRFHIEVLLPLAEKGLCVIEDPPCECPEYDDGYYATFFRDPDGLKYEFVINPGHLRRKSERVE